MKNKNKKTLLFQTNNESIPVTWEPNWEPEELDDTLLTILEGMLCGF